MYSTTLRAKAFRCTTTGLIAAFLAVCAVSVAPAAAATPTTATSVQHSAAASDGSGKRSTLDGFHW